jgi:hypothetical protein
MIAARIAMRREAEGLERKAALLAEGMMIESAARLRNQAAGIRRAIEILEEDARLEKELKTQDLKTQDARGGDGI